MAYNLTGDQNFWVSRNGTRMYFDQSWLSEDKGPGLLVFATALPALSACVVALRLYVRLFMLRSCGIDDYLIFAATVSWLIH